MPLNIDLDRLRDFVEGSGLVYKENSASYIFRCPKCGKEDKAYLSKTHGHFICWSEAETSGYKGRPEYLLADLCLRPIAEIRELLYGTAVVNAGLGLGGFDTLIRHYFSPDDDLDEDAFEAQTIAWPHDHYELTDPRSAEGVAYLESRGIPLDVAQRYHLRYSPNESRVVIPVERDGRLVGYQKRWVGETRYWDPRKETWAERMKIVSSKGIPTSHCLMFSDDMKGAEHVILCEGPFDAIKVGYLSGGAVASMGKQVSKGQIAFIRHQGIKKVYLALDPDACRRTEALVREFSDLDCYIIEPPAGAKDLGELDFEQAYECFLDARPVIRSTTGQLFLHLGKR